MDVKHFLRAFSFRLFFAVCALNVIGILAINSATNQSMAYVGRQATGMALGIAIIALICFVPYQKLLRYAVLVFAICAILLLMVRFFGRSVNGAKRWVVLPGVGQVQPSDSRDSQHTCHAVCGRAQLSLDRAFHVGCGSLRSEYLVSLAKRHGAVPKGLSGAAYFGLSLPG